MLLNSSRCITREATFSKITKCPQLNTMSSRNLSAKTNRKIFAVRHDNYIVKKKIYFNEARYYSNQSARDRDQAETKAGKDLEESVEMAKEAFDNKTSPNLEKRKFGEDYVKEKFGGKNVESKSDVRSSETRNSDQAQSLGERVLAAVKALKDKATEIFQNARAEYDKTQNQRSRDRDQAETQAGKELHDSVKMAKEAFDNKTSENPAEKNSNQRSRARDQAETEAGKELHDSVKMAKEAFDNKTSENPTEKNSNQSHQRSRDRDQADTKASKDLEDSVKMAKEELDKNSPNLENRKSREDNAKEKTAGKKDEVKHNVNSAEAKELNQALGAAAKAVNKDSDAKAENNKKKGKEEL